MKRKKVLGVALLSALTFGSVVGMTACGGTPAEDTEGQEEDLTVTWTGLDTVTLQMGDTAPDPLAGVTATASNGDTLTVVIDEDNSLDIDTGYPGTYTVYYYAKDADGNYVDEEGTGYAWKTFTVERGTTLDNSTFDTGIEHWSGNGNAGSVVNFSWDSTEKALLATISNAGKEYWNNQAEYNGLNLKANTTYKITFKAKSNSGRNIGVTMEIPAEGYKVVETPNCYGLATTTEYQTFDFYYTTGDADLSSIKFGFLLGRFTEADDVEDPNNPDKVWIDDITITALATKANSTGVTFANAGTYKLDPLNPIASIADAPQVTATDAEGNDITDELVKTGVIPTKFNSDMTIANFAEQYMYTDEDGNISYVRREFSWSLSADLENPYSTANSDFTDGLNWWTKEENGIVTITHDAEEGAAVIEAVNNSSNEADWRAQLQQNNVGNKLTAGETYYVEVRAKVDNPDVRTLRLEFCANAGGNANAKSDLIFTEADTYQVFKSAEYTPTADVTGGNLRVGLLLAEYNVKYTLTVDYIKIVKVAE